MPATAAHLSTTTGLRRAGLVLAAVAALAAGTAPAAWADPGDWTQLSQFPEGSSYPGGRNIDEPTMARFGDTVQVLWHAEMSPSANSYFTAILDNTGNVTVPSRELFTSWTDLIENPSLIAIGGQRFLGFSGLNPGRTGAAYYATSPDGTAWTIGTGALSATQAAYASYGNDVVDNGGSPVWVGNAGSTNGVAWHAGISATDPAPAGSDGRFELTGCCAYGAAAARDQVTGTVYAAFYSNSDAASEQGIQFGQILPTPGGFARAPESFVTSSGGAVDSLDPGQRVAMTARPGGGVFIAYKVGYPTTERINVVNITSGAVMRVPGSQGAKNISLSAGADGRIWVAWLEGNRAFTAHSNAAGTFMGAAGSWAAPRGTTTLWKTALSAGGAGADLVITASKGGQINTWNTIVTPTLSIAVAPARPARRGAVRFTVTEAGTPVAGVRVRFAGRTGTTNAAGKVTLAAPASSGGARATAQKTGFHPGSAIVPVR